jgi:thiol:disulfide interchange protein DsbC
MQIGEVMDSIKYLVIYALCSLSAMASAESTQEAQIKKLIEPRMGVNIKVDAVRKTPYAGLFEIQTNGDIFYTDEKAQYLIIGRVVDTKTYKDLTKMRVDEINAVNFLDLPLESAIKFVKGNGKRVMAIFEDPNCPYCRSLHHTLQSIDNVTVYVFMLNIVMEDSAARSKNIWCSADPKKSWEDMMLEGKVAPTAAADCATPNEKILALGKKLKILGTPTIYFADGSRAGNIAEAKLLEARLASAK